MNHNPHDTGFVTGILDRVPLRVSGFVERAYSRLYADQGRQAANQYLLGVCDLMDSKRFLSADDAALRARAEREAGRCRGLTLEAGEAYLAGFGLSLPVAETEAGVLARLACPLWWTRALIRRHDRETEHFSIQVGVVRKGVQAYCSNALLDRVLQRHASAMAMMASWEAVSDEGDTLPLLDVLKGSTANPEVRRAELMVRMRGFEHYANEQDHVARFYTLTCPSKFHRYSGSALNPHYQNATPKEAQAYLCSVWARIRASLKRDGLNVYGFRVAEPHHDACPHWHLLLFMAPEHADAVTATLQHHALLEDGDEPGAAEHRFKVEAIDLAKGSATGYLAKYISKNIDGFGVGTDEETGEDAGDSARRVRAWASVWGIRQFQQVGGAPVGVWRELRRLDMAPDGLLEDARQAADAGDWAAYLHLQGGADANRKD